MKKLLFFAAMLSLCIACNNKQSGTTEDEERQDNDTTLYGVCGDGSAMHTLELITNMQDTIFIHIDDEDSTHLTKMLGGMTNGDRMAVTAYDDGGQALEGVRIINITTLLGRWNSLDRDFDISEDGEVRSNLTSESDPWTSWRILNGQLLLNSDTFDIVSLTPDSLELENKDGIYGFRRFEPDVVEPADSTQAE